MPCLFRASFGASDWLCFAILRRWYQLRNLHIMMPDPPTTPCRPEPENPYKLTEFNYDCLLPATLTPSAKIKSILEAFADLM